MLNIFSVYLVVVGEQGSMLYKWDETKNVFLMVQVIIIIYHHTITVSVIAYSMPHFIFSSFNPEMKIDSLNGLHSLLILLDYRIRIGYTKNKTTWIFLDKCHSFLVFKNFKFHLESLSCSLSHTE